MAGNLTARKVETARPGKYSDGGNLYLIVSPASRASGCYASPGVAERRKWVLEVQAVFLLLMPARRQRRPA